ncbi:hypothetical protein LSAT2_022324 [Lamellibrachia satsuma]|nr:hypothetical protein LSAT2_022324 [Lamellibrachia satsuma]
MVTRCPSDKCHLLTPLCSTLCDKFGCRKVALVGSILLSLGTFISAFAGSIFFLYFSFGLLAGSGGAMVFTAGYVIVSQYFDKRKGKAMAFATLGSGIGNIVLSPALSAWFDVYGYSGSMLILSSLMLNNFVGAALYRPIHMAAWKKTAVQTEERMTEEKRAIFIGNKTSVIISETLSDDVKRDTRLPSGGEDCDDDDCDKVIVLPDKRDDDDCDKDDDDCDKVIVLPDKRDLSAIKQTESTESITLVADAPEASTVDDHSNSSCRKYLRLLKNQTFLLYGYQIMCMQVCISVYLIFVADFALENGTNRMDAAFILSMMGISDMVGRIFFGFVFDLECMRSHRPKLHSAFGIAFGLVTACVMFLPSYSGMLAIGAVVGVMESAVHSQRATVATQLVTPLDMSSAIGLMIFFQGVGNIWGPPIAGLLRDVTGTSAYCFVLGGLVMATSSLICLIHYCCVGRSSLARSSTHVDQ